jgi:dipeptidyl aminopeptidase/acylaminoacyl peptidase
MDLSPAGLGLNARPLIESTHLDGGGDYSPDGKRIVFVSTRSGDLEAWIAAIDGSHLRQLTHLGGVFHTRFSPDGRHIAFTRAESKDYHLYVADVDTGAVRRITNNAWADVDPHWSSDGAWIYFDSGRTGRQEVWKVGASGGEPVQITHNGGLNAFESADGKYLYFAREETGVGYVWRKSLTSGAEERLFPAIVMGGSMAMGTRRLYFVRNPNTYGYGQSIYAYELASGHIVKVAEAPVFYLSVLPDESRLLFGHGAMPGADLMLVEGLPKSRLF